MRTKLARHCKFRHCERSEAIPVIASSVIASEAKQSPSLRAPSLRAKRSNPRHCEASGRSKLPTTASQALNAAHRSKAATFARRQSLARLFGLYEELKEIASLRSQ